MAGFEKVVPNKYEIKTDEPMLTKLLPIKIVESVQPNDFKCFFRTLPVLLFLLISSCILAGLTDEYAVSDAENIEDNIIKATIRHDYMQLILGPKGISSENRQSELSTISRGLKQLARELSVPVIALSQLSRRVEQREDKRPLMSDIRESGAIEQDADLIMFLYRDSYYNPKQNMDNPEEQKHQVTEVIISKHRNGATGKLELVFDPSIGLFQNKPKGEF